MEQFSLKEYLKNSNRKVVTRDGIEVKIIYTDFDREYPIVGTIKGHTFPTLFTEKGCYNSDGASSPYDLFFAPEKKEKKEKYEGWINLCRNKFNELCSSSHPYNSEEEARKVAMYLDNYIVTIKIEWEE